MENFGNYKYGKQKCLRWACAASHLAYAGVNLNKLWYKLD